MAGWHAIKIIVWIIFFFLCVFFLFMWLLFMHVMLILVLKTLVSSWYVTYIDKNLKELGECSCLRFMFCCPFLGFIHFNCGGLGFLWVSAWLPGFDPITFDISCFRKFQIINLESLCADKKYSNGLLWIVAHD